MPTSVIGPETPPAGPGVPTEGNGAIGRHLEEPAAAAEVLSFLATLATTVLALFAVGKTASFPADLAHCLATYAVPEESLRPEPAERALFLGGLCLFPALLVAYGLAFRAWARRRSATSGGWPVALAPARLRGAVVAASLGWAAFVLPWHGRFYLRQTVGLDAWAVPASAAAALFAYVVFRSLRAGAGAPDTPAGRRLAALLQALCVGLAAAAAAGSVFGLRAVTNEPHFIFSFNAVFHGVVQVFQGKALLIDLDHQYGLYPHFLEPLFRVTGLSVLTFTLTMAAIGAAALFLLCRFLAEATANAVVRALGCAALIASTLLAGAPPAPWAYFQYFPLRFVFPALVVFLSHRALRRECAGGWYWAAHAAAALAPLWNADTGLVAFVAWAATPAFHACCARRPRSALVHLLRAGAALALACALFAAYLRLRYGSWPDFGAQFRYQELFYICGFMMEPMPLLHPWHLVLLVYAAGLLRAVTALLEGAASVRSSAVFQLSVLGAGLFSYYQGRSFDGNLISYPAVLLTALWADRLSERLRRGADCGERMLLAAILFAWSVSLAGPARNLPALARESRERLARTFSGADTGLTRGIALLRRHFPPGSEVLIFSGHSGIYALETGIRPPSVLQVSSLSIRAADYLALDHYLHAPGTRRVVYDLTTGNDNLAAALFKAYRVRDRTPDLLVTVLEK